MVSIGLRLAQVMPRHAVVVGDNLLVLLGAEQLLLQEHARGCAIRTDPLDVPEDRPALRVGDLLEPAPPVDALHVGDRCGIKRRSAIPVCAAELDVLGPNIAKLSSGATAAVTHDRDATIHRPGSPETAATRVPFSVMSGRQEIRRGFDRQALVQIQFKDAVGIDMVVDERRQRPEVLRGHRRQPYGFREDLLEHQGVDVD
jgi:hypothetical protein